MPGADPPSSTGQKIRIAGNLIWRVFSKCYGRNRPLPSFAMSGVGSSPCTGLLPTGDPLSFMSGLEPWPSASRMPPMHLSGLGIGFFWPRLWIPPSSGLRGCACGSPSGSQGASRLLKVWGKPLRHGLGEWKVFRASGMAKPRSRPEPQSSHLDFCEAWVSPTSPVGFLPEAGLHPD